MSKYLNRLRFSSAWIQMQAMTYVMMSFTVVYGVGFIFFGWTPSVQDSLLFQATQVELGPKAISLWGVSCLVAVSLSLLSILFRKRWLGIPGGFLGVLVWTYACLAYASLGLWFQLCLNIQQLLFWGWYYQRVRKYYRDGLIDPKFML